MCIRDRGGPLTNIFATPANFNRPLYQSQDLIRTLNIFSYYLSSLLLIQHKNFNFKAHFLFSKKCKGGTLDKNFLILLQILTDHCTKVRTSFELSIFFHIIWAPYYWFSRKILILMHIFYFLKSVKRGDPWQIFLQLLQTLTGHCTKVRSSFEL